MVVDYFSPVTLYSREKENIATSISKTTFKKVIYGHNILSSWVNTDSISSYPWYVFTCTCIFIKIHKLSSHKRQIYTQNLHVCGSVVSPKSVSPFGTRQHFVPSFSSKYIMTSRRYQKRDVSIGSGVMALCFVRPNDGKIGLFFIGNKRLGEK